MEVQVNGMGVLILCRVYKLLQLFPETPVDNFFIDGEQEDFWGGEVRGWRTPLPPFPPPSFLPLVFFISLPKLFQLWPLETLSVAPRSL